MSFKLTEAYAYIFCFHTWPYILKVFTSSSETVDVFIIAVYVFRSLFCKIGPLVYANFNKVFEMFQGLLFCYSLIVKRCAENEVA